MNKRILIIDDDTELCRLLKQCLENEGFATDCLNGEKNADVFLKKII